MYLYYHLSYETPLCLQDNFWGYGFSPHHARCGATGTKRRQFLEIKILIYEICGWSKFLSVGELSQAELIECLLRSDNHVSQWLRMRSLMKHLGWIVFIMVKGSRLHRDRV